MDSLSWPPTSTSAFGHRYGNVIRGAPSHPVSADQLLPLAKIDLQELQTVVQSPCKADYVPGLPLRIVVAGKSSYVCTAWRQFLSACPFKSASLSRAGEVVVSSIICALIQVQSPHLAGTHTVASIVDSRADRNIMDDNLALQLGIPRVLLPKPSPQVPRMDLSWAGSLNQTSPVCMRTSGTHLETIQLLPSSPLASDFRVSPVLETQISH